MLQSQSTGPFLSRPSPQPEPTFDPCPVLGPQVPRLRPPPRFRLLSDQSDRSPRSQRVSSEGDALSRRLSCGSGSRNSCRPAGGDDGSTDAWVPRPPRRADTTVGTRGADTPLTVVVQ